MPLCFFAILPWLPIMPAKAWTSLLSKLLLKWNWWWNFTCVWTIYLKFEIYFLEFTSLMSRIERKYCLLITSYMAGLFDIFILLHIWQNCMCFRDFLTMRTLCDAYHNPGHISFTWKIFIRAVWSQTTVYIFSFWRIQKGM